MTELLDNIFAIEIPDNAYNFSFIEITKDRKAVQWIYHSGNGLTFAPETGSYILPPGSYEILFAMKEVSEDQAASIVELDRGGFAGNVEGYKEYLKPGDWPMDHEPFASAIKSLQSLLKSKGLTAGNYLIVKKIR